MDRGIVVEVISRALGCGSGPQTKRNAAFEGSGVINCLDCTRRIAFPVGIMGADWFLCAADWAMFPRPVFTGNQKPVSLIEMVLTVIPTSKKLPKP